MLRTFRLIAVAVVAVFALSMPAFAGQAKPAAKPAAKAAKALTLSGTLQKVAGQDLTIQTAKGTEEVMFGSDVKIRRGGKTLSTSDLASASGSKVTVRYKEDNGHKMAESVTLAAAPKQVASAKPQATGDFPLTGSRRREPEVLLDAGNGVLLQRVMQTNHLVIEREDVFSEQTRADSIESRHGRKVLGRPVSYDACRRGERAERARADQIHAEFSSATDTLRRGDGDGSHRPPRGCRSDDGRLDARLVPRSRVREERRGGHRVRT